MEEEENVLRWKWEFMRRNPEYKADYKKLQKLRGKIGYEHLIKQIDKDRNRWCKNHQIKGNNFVIDDKCDKWLRRKRKNEIEIIELYKQEEMKYSKKWSSGWLGKIYDPDKSFEGILNLRADMDDIKKYAEELTAKWAFAKGLDSGAVREIKYMVFSDGRAGFIDLLNIEPSDYFLKINFNAVNSINSLKKSL